MTTHIPKIGEADRRWFVIDAKDQVLGKLATTAAVILTGKGKPIYTPFLDTGDHVIVINAAEVHLTGRKALGKLYRHHTGYMGGLKETKLADMLRRRPERVLELAVRGMLPRNKLARHLLGHMKVYKGPEHPHAAQVRASEKKRARPAVTAKTEE